eukprot:scaffold2112_cov376-Prasinococcus_capsulatus_cf.AAC.2
MVPFLVDKGAYVNAVDFQVRPSAASQRLGTSGNRLWPMSNCLALAPWSARTGRHSALACMSPKFCSNCEGAAGMQARCNVQEQAWPHSTRRGDHQAKVGRGAGAA